MVSICYSTQDRGWKKQRSSYHGFGGSETKSSVLAGFHCARKQLKAVLVIVLLLICDEVATCVSL